MTTRRIFSRENTARHKTWARMVRWFGFAVIAFLPYSMGCNGSGGGEPSGPTSLKSSAIPSEIRMGDSAYNRFCVACHGPSAVGTERGPSFINRIYEPGHHGDPAFVLAARMGVRAHHWNFGDMPRIEAVSDEELAQIISYVRWLQRKAGIG